MKRFVVVLVAAVLVVALFLFVSANGDGVRRAGKENVGSATAQGVSAEGSSGAANVAESSAPWRQPAPKQTYEFNPPIFRALPGGLNGRSLKDIYDELAKRAEGGDAEAARILGDLVIECGLMIEAKRWGKRFGSPDPRVQKYIEDRERIAGKECPMLGEQALGSANAWLMRAVEGGDRRAISRLQFHPPKPTEPDVEAKKKKWRALVIDRLERLGNDGDFEAMIELAYFYLDEGVPESNKEAYVWFDKASRAPVDAERVSRASRLREIAGQRIAADEQRGR